MVFKFFYCTNYRDIQSVPREKQDKSGYLGTMLSASIQSKTQGAH